MKQLAVLLVLCVSSMHSQTAYVNVYLHGGGTTSIPLHEIQRITFSGITDVKNDQLATVIRTFILLQNYPNPFNPTTTIQYDLQRSGQVQIKVFNINGQLVRTIDKVHESQGTHDVVWDAKSNDAQLMPSGVYFYQVTFENSTLTRKMLFVK